jgi:FkbM family methyltransferase
MKSKIYQKIKSIAARICPHLPGPWQLPLLCGVFRHTTDDEREAFSLDLIGPCEGKAVDIGANYGLYCLPLSKVYSTVIAFEPNTRVAAPLRNAKLKNVQVIHEGVSSAHGQAILHIPVSKGVILSGWASLEDQNAADSDSVIDLAVTINTLDSHAIDQVRFIKIDVEGHELEVLHGAEQTIRKYKPHLLIEIQDKHLPAIRSLLANWAYTETTLQNLGGPQGSPQNYIFIPTSKFS